ncbi:MAG: YHS domain-containing protein [Candidatus Scalindua sp.]
MRRNLIFGLVFVFSLGFSITYAKNSIYASEGGKVIDRVCTMQIDKSSAETLTKDGYTYYFCSNNCKTAFANSPEKYACICPQLFEGCDCGHCAGIGVPCECAEAHAESHTGGQGHEHSHENEGGEHHH